MDISFRTALVLAITLVFACIAAYLAYQPSAAMRERFKEESSRSHLPAPAAHEPGANFAPYKAGGGGGRSPCDPKQRLSAEDLLPRDAANTKWAQMNPAGQGDLKDKNFLTAGYHVGINTVGQTLRNPNYQLRSEPPNPQKNVGPWQQSTIDPDTNRRHFEVGEF
jgi:hypothetical protein